MCTLCGKVGVYPIALNRSKRRYVGRLEEALKARMQYEEAKKKGKFKGKRNSSHNDDKCIFAHLLGQGQLLLDIDEAAKHYQVRDYPKLAYFKGQTIGPTFLPSVFINYCPKIVQDFDEALENVHEMLKILEDEEHNDPSGCLGHDSTKKRSEEIRFLKNHKIPEIERAKSDFVEKEVVDQLKAYLDEHNVTSFVIRGLEVFKLGSVKGRDQQEIDILLIDYDHQIICNIEVKTRLHGNYASKAGWQLERIRSILMDYFDSELRGQWTFVSAAYCTSVEDGIKECPNANRFVFCRDDHDFQEKLEMIVSGANKGKTLHKYPADFSMLTRYITYLSSKFELPTTTNIHSKIKETLEKAGSIENIKFLACPTRQQQNLIKACDHPGYKMAFIGAWGTGKTMLLKHCAVQLAKKHEKVLYIVVQDGDLVKSRGIKSQLILELEESFHEFEDFIEVISLPIRNDQPTQIKEVTKGFKHVMIDEFFDDFDLFHQSTKDEILTTLNNVETVALALSNSYFYERLPNDINVEDKVQNMFPTFEVFQLNIPLRQPKNIVTDLQEHLNDASGTVDLTFNQRLVVEAKVSPNLIEGFEPQSLGTDDAQSLFPLLKKAFEVSDQKALIVIMDVIDGNDAFINKQISDMIQCQCKDKALYIAIDVALELIGRPKPLFLTLGIQSKESALKSWVARRQRDCDLVISDCLIKGCENEFIINTLTGCAEPKSRVTGQLVELGTQWYLTLLLIVQYLNNQEHVCDEILNRTQRPPISKLNLDINNLLDQVASMNGYCISTTMPSLQNYYLTQSPILECLIDQLQDSRFQDSLDMANEIIQALENETIDWPDSDLITKGHWISKMKADISFQWNYSTNAHEMEAYDHLLLDLASKFLKAKIKLVPFDITKPRPPKIFNSKGAKELILLGCTTIWPENFYLSLVKNPQNPCCLMM